MIRESHCRGFEEPDEWTVREWRRAQGVDPYDEMNDLLMDIISLKNRTPRSRLTHHENELFFMACYDLDRFRDHVFEKRLWEILHAEQEVVKPPADDDVSLMRFGMEWIKHELFGEELEKERQKTYHESTKERRKHESKNT